MTDAASKDDSENNLAAFELGVYANQFLWNLDQAFVAESEPHRNMALGLIERLSAIGAAFTEMKNNAPFENFLREIRGYLPATLRSQRVEALEDFISEIFNVDSDLSEGERWYQFLDPFGQEREKLRKILFDDTVQTLQQRQWFRLGWLIDAGRHPPDTGHCLYKFQPTRNRRRLPPALAQPDLINDDEPEVPMFRTFEAGELSPQGEWWQSVFGLGQQLDVPCNSNEPDQSTASSVVDAVEQMIASVRETIAPLQSDALPLVMTRPAPLLDPPANDVEKHGLWEFVAGKVRFREGGWHKLSPIQWGILKCLAANRYPVSRMQLIEAGWKGDTNTDDNAVRTALTRLRKRLSEFVKLEKGESPINSVPTPHGDHQELHESLRLTDPVTST